MPSPSDPLPKEADPISKALALGSYFVWGCLAINISQILAAPLSTINSKWYNSWISFTKQQFAVLTMNMTQRWAPTVVKVSGDASVRGQLFETTSGDLLCLFPKRMILIANHQIYTDWLYLWWIAYSNGMHGRIFIVLKESLKHIPVIGWGMQLCQFIFLKRNWEHDKPQMATHLQTLNNMQDPMWLLLFPEGTNLAPSTREASARWATKNGIKDMKHTLLPRATGLQFCVQELRETIGYVYDCTIAYEGVKQGQYAQDLYTLQASYVGGKPPKCVHMYWRRFPISQIPLFDDRHFELWLRARWIEKDALIEYFYNYGHFPADIGVEKSSDGKMRRGAGHIDSTIKASKWNTFLHQFMPMGLLAMVLFTFYGTLPETYQQALKQHPLLKGISELPEVQIKDQQTARLGKLGNKGAVSSVPTAKKQTRRTERTQEPQSQVHAGHASEDMLIISKQKRCPKLGPRRETVSKHSSVTEAPSSVSSAPIASGILPKLGPRKHKPLIAQAPLKSALKAPQNARPSASSTGSSRSPSKKVQIIDPVMQVC